MTKKDVTQAAQGLKIMIYSQFIINFNDKTVLARLIELLRAPSSHEVREGILKNMVELSRHYSIRGTLLSRKLLSKLMKSINDHLCTLMTAGSDLRSSLGSQMSKGL